MVPHRQPPHRVLMGPGPSDVADSVLRALSAPCVSHLDPWFLRVMDEVQQMLRTVIGTGNHTTLPISGTGTGGMEATLVNLLQRGDRLLVGVNGYFGGRIADIGRRCGAEVVVVEGQWGRALQIDQLRNAAAGRRFEVVAVVHAETSTGVLQDLSGLRAFADEVGALLLVDAVTSLGGLPVEMDRHGIDALYSGSQKCLSAPPGLAPVSISDRAMAAIKARREPVQSFYFDLSLLEAYWGLPPSAMPQPGRAYHHTAPTNMVVAFHEALRLVLDEGLDARYARHRRHSRALVAGLEALGLELPVPVGERLPQLSAVAVPAGVDEAAVRVHLLREHGLEIGGGLGPMKGKVWRIGLMGSACTRRNVTLCIGALGAALRAQGAHADVGEALGAADLALASGS